MRLRQVALVARDLEPTLEVLCDLLETPVLFRDPGVAEFGLANGLLALGPTFLEVVSPVAADAPARRWIARRGGDAGYMAIFQCEPEGLDARVERAEAAGHRAVWRGEREGGRTVHFHPRELGAIVSLDAMPAWEDWVWAGPHWDGSHAARTPAIVGVTLAGPAPEALAERWGALLGIEPSRGRGTRAAIELPRGGTLRFGRGEGPALVGLEVAGCDPGRFAERARARGVLGTDGAARIAGTRIGLV